MEDISLHILDIAENSISSSAKRIEIRIDENPAKNVLTIEIKDDGKGMDEQAVQRALDPFFTTKPTRKVGLGLSLLAQAARECGGTMELDSRPGRGTTVRAAFRTSHPDCKPVGNIYETIRTLVASHLDIDFLFEHRKNGSVYHFDTRETYKK
jgi:K+-sensing histidine kinase KdpD